MVERIIFTEPKFCLWFWSRTSVSGIDKTQNLPGTLLTEIESWTSRDCLFQDFQKSRDHFEMMLVRDLENCFFPEGKGPSGELSSDFFDFFDGSLNFSILRVFVFRFLADSLFFSIMIFSQP